MFLQTIEHLEDPGAVLDHFRSLVGERGRVFVSTPNVLTLAPKGAPRSDNPWHVHEYRREEFERLCRRALRAAWRCTGSSTRASCARTSSRCVSAGTGPPSGCASREPFYGWFTPAIAASDFALRAAGEADLDRALDFLAVCRP